MSFRQDIVQERGKLIKVTLGSKLGKTITDRILMPILDQLENDYEAVLADAADWARDQIVDYLMNSTPTGRTYKIVEYEPGVGSRIIGEHTASAKGQPPASLTGTLVNSIGYEVSSDGSFKVGLLKEWGEYSDAETEFESVAFRFGKILVNNDLDKSTKTPVGTYGRALEGGFTNATMGSEVHRPWFENTMDGIRDELRQRIRKGMRKSLNKATRKTSIRKAIIFKVYYK